MVPKGMVLKLVLLSGNAIEKLSDNNYEKFREKLKSKNDQKSLIFHEF